MTGSRPPRLALAVLALALAGLCTAFAGGLIDDAYIVFRYADNLLAGHGAVFNPGERVEGFTSPLWLFLLAGCRASGLPYETAVTLLGAACALATLVPAHALTLRTASSPALALLLGPGLLALHPSFALWAVHGLETPLFVLIVTGAAWAWSLDTRRSALLAGLLLGLGFWIRPEAPLLALLLAACALARGERSRAARLVAGFAALALLLVAARLAYYGAWVPNTYHAKTGGLPGRLVFGLAEAKRFTVAHLPLVAACAWSGWLLVTGGKRAARSLAEPSPARRVLFDWIVLGAAWSVYLVWAGGDAFPGYRFWLPVLPLAGAVAAWGICRLPTSPRTTLAAGVLLVAWVALGALPEARLEHVNGREFTAKMTAVGSWLGRHAPRGTRIALNYVGALPYHAGLPALDMLGLTDPVIARTPIRGRFRFTGHARGNGASVLDRRPDLIFMNGVYLEAEPMRELAPQLDSEEQIAADPRFAAEYVQVQVRIPGPSGPGWLAFYRRRDIAWDPTMDPGPAGPSTP